MINLAGNQDADRYIQEELYLAGIPTAPKRAKGEVPYTIIGVLHNWIFERAWYYYIASHLTDLGLPYHIAVELHERCYPIRDPRYQTLGQSIRVDGPCGCPHPKEGRYPSKTSLEAEFAEAREKFPGINFDPEGALARASLRELDGTKFIRLYHVDTLVGLRELARTIEELRTIKEA